MYEPPHVAIYPSSIGSTVHETYHYSQLQLSERLARDYPGTLATFAIDHLFSLLRACFWNFHGGSISSRGLAKLCSTANAAVHGTLG